MLDFAHIILSQIKYNQEPNKLDYKASNIYASYP